MPRPGPRPYECSKRAWHSERHQPVRGSIIREIFRIANEAHNQATRKNREWQEKLPYVVFKAEEILYSKAASEDEYAERSTLWKRVNEAVDTIIRRDEGEETGDLLLPCIEAALTVGCVPRRASRSQRHIHSSYLTPAMEEARERAQASCSQRCVGDGDRRQLQPSPAWANSGRVYPLFPSSWGDQSSSALCRRQDDYAPEETRGNEEAGGCDLSLRLSLPTAGTMPPVPREENSGGFFIETPSKKRSVAKEDEYEALRRRGSVGGSWENECLGQEWRRPAVLGQGWDGKKARPPLGGEAATARHSRGMFDDGL